MAFSRQQLETLLLRRFFFAPSFQIYGGIAGLYDYGPAGTALQNNIIALWRKHFVLEEDMLEIECTNLTPEAVLKTSGHVDRFADYMVKDTVTGDIFRADHLVKQVLKDRLCGSDKKKTKVDASTKSEYENILESLDNYQGNDLWLLMQKLEITSPETGNEISEPKLFNLMFETQIGPTGQFRGFLRPETAQGHFVNFKRLLESNNDQMPFASASIGKSFRNEISPRQGLLRVREFTMSEIEHFVDPLNKAHPRFKEVANTVMTLYSSKAQLAAQGPIEISIGEAVSSKLVDNETLGYFMARIHLFLLKIGIDRSRLRFRQHMQNEMAHYASDCWDAEIESSYGWIECVGCADRSAYDLTCHSKATKEKLVVREALKEPITKNVTCLDIKQAVFGPVFKAKAKSVMGGLHSLLADGEEWDDEKYKDSTLAWDESKLAVVKSQLTEVGHIKITGSDGLDYEVTSKMIQVVEKTVKISVREYTPNVIEPSFGLGRILYSLLEHSYRTRQDDEKRAFLKFPALVAPTKILVAPISANEKFVELTNKICSRARSTGLSCKIDDSGASIGRRYARNDEVGTPFAITIDFESCVDGSVTLRERDSMRQVRGKFEVIVDLVDDLCNERKTWADAEKLLSVVE